MKNALTAILGVALLASPAFAAGKGPDIRIIDNQVSVQVESVPLGRLLRLLDQATGMTSKVPPELANRTISARFSNLKLEDAVKKLFEGQSIDYIVVPGKSITVTGASRLLTAQGGAAPYNPPAQENNPFDNDNPQPFMPQPPNPANQPAVIQTPFGPIQNPNRQIQGQAGQQPNGPTPMVLPGQMSPGLNNSGGINTPFGNIQNNNPNVPQNPTTMPSLQPNPFNNPPIAPTTPAPSGMQTSPFPSSTPPRPNP